MHSIVKLKLNLMITPVARSVCQCHGDCQVASARLLPGPTLAEPARREAASVASPAAHWHSHWRSSSRFEAPRRAAAGAAAAAGNQLES